MARGGVLAGAGYTGAPFVLFGPSHLAALAVTVLLLVAMVRGFRGSSGKVKTCARWTLALLLWGQEISFHAWRVITGTWSVQEMLPLHLCALGVWLGGLMLVTGSRALFSVLYFTSLAGAAVALLTPDIGAFGFPHYRYWQFFISHGLVVAAPLWMTFVEGMRPTRRDLVRTTVLVNVYAGFVFVVNSLVGSDYMFINGKPTTASPLDLMPLWPWYLLIMEALLLVVFVLLYLPWVGRDPTRGPRRRSGDIALRR